jgi:hypothetical protein
LYCECHGIEKAFIDTEDGPHHSKLVRVPAMGASAFITSFRSSWKGEGGCVTSQRSLLLLTLLSEAW